MTASKPETSHLPYLSALGIPQCAAQDIDRYLSLLADWNVRVNLTAARTPAERVHVLVRQVLAPLAWIPGGSVIDVGSGNGSPGIVWALMRPDCRVILLEPRLRRWAFLREAARIVAGPVDVVRARHDRYSGPRAGTVVLRALSLPWGELAPMLQESGSLVVWNPSNRDERLFEYLRHDPGGWHLFRKRST